MTIGGTRRIRSRPMSILPAPICFIIPNRISIRIPITF